MMLINNLLILFTFTLCASHSSMKEIQETGQASQIIIEQTENSETTDPLPLNDQPGL